MTTQNGLLLHAAVEEAIDDSAITVMADIPLDPTKAQVKLFHKSNPKNYRWRVVNPDSVSLNELVAEEGYQNIEKEIRVRDLDGKLLCFRNDNRPRARYLYWIFCVAMLRLAWKMENRDKPCILCRTSETRR
jgi:hypothetical protein